MSGEMASIRVQFVQLSPVNPAQVPAGALFLDNTNSDIATIKSVSNIVAPVETGDPAGSLFIKKMMASAAFSANRPLGKLTNGKVVDADSDGVPGADNFCGYSLQAATADGDLIDVLCPGPNLAGALTGLGFSTGQEIYLSQDSGYTNDPGTLVGNNDSIIKLGIADCAASTATGTAVDLIAFSSIISRRD